MANPIFRMLNHRSSAEDIETWSFAGGQTMTVDGTIKITGIMGLIMVLAASYVWTRYSYGYMDFVTMLTAGGSIGAFILALIISFSRLSPKFGLIKYLTPFYALFQGFALGGISAFFEASAPGIVSQALAATFAAFFVMLLLYKFRAISCTQKFRSFILISTFSILVIYLVDFIAHFLGYSLPVIYSSSPLGLLFSLIIVVIASLSLILDFDFIEQGAMRNYPQEYEWYGAFGLLVTMIWMYVEILKLLSKIQRR